MYRSVLVAVLSVFVASAAAAQETQPRSRIWAGAGLASGGGSEMSGVGLIGQFVFQRQPHSIALRGVVLDDLSGFPDSGGDDVIGELGLLYGRTRVIGPGHVGFSLGVSGVALDPCPHDDDPCFMVGVPLVAEAALSAKVVGVGLQLFGNINAKMTYAGVAAFLQLGWLP
jgi:hypothetical protein